MFVRQKPNRSGSVSVQVIDKTHGYRVVKTISSARDPEEIERLVEIGKAFIARQSRQYPLFPVNQQSNAVALDVIRTLENASIRTIGPELIFGRLFDEIGFNAIPKQLFRDIVVARLMYPMTRKIIENCCKWTRNSQRSTICSTNQPSGVPMRKSGMFAGATVPVIPRPHNARRCSVVHGRECEFHGAIVFTAVNR